MARLSEDKCTSVEYQSACYWIGPPDPTPGSCARQMQKRCGSTANEADCQTCMVAHHDELMTYPQTGKSY
jgi:hypothetical protein